MTVVEMAENPTTAPARTLNILVTAACGVAIWKVAALLLVLQADSSEDSLVVKVLLAVLGMVFVACGLLVFWKTRSQQSLLFAAFCLCSGLHWGGPLELSSAPLRTGFLLLFLVVSSVLGEVFFLRLALSFPRQSRLANRRSLLWFLYAPPIVATVLAAIYLVAPSESSLHEATQQSFLLLVSVAGNLFAVIAFAFFVSHLFRAGLTGTQKMYVGLMVIGMLTAWLPYLVAENAGVDMAPWTLTFAALPVAFAIAFLGIARDVRRGQAG